jgi:hypothetical protein
MKSIDRSHRVAESAAHFREQSIVHSFHSLHRLVVLATFSPDRGWPDKGIPAADELQQG